MKAHQNCSIENIEKLFRNKQKIAIITHIYPDADGLSSLVFLKDRLENCFNNAKKTKKIDIYADVVELDEIYNPILKKDHLNDQNIVGRYDLAIGVDCTDTGRFGRFKHIFTNAKETLNIDHHETNTFFADYNFVHKTSSTCELLYLTMAKMKVEMPASICKLVYAGIITDTNNLTQGNVNDKTYAIINKFVRNGVEIDKVQEHFFKNNSLSKMKLLEKAIHSLKFSADGKLAIMKLNKADFVECGANPNTDTLGIVDYAISLKDAKIAMLLVKQEDNSYHISLRSKGQINVGQIARQFGGGGHQNMAAFNADAISDFKDDFIRVSVKEIQKTEEQQDRANNLFFDEPNARSGDFEI